MNKETINHNSEVTEKGSLGLLALGDVGLRVWREVKKQAKSKRQNEQKK